jgi:hypothetical protein
MQATIDRQRKELAKQQQKLAEYQEKDRKTLFPSHICIGHSTDCTVDADEEDASDGGEEDPESQDEEDIGYGARSGGGFTSMVRFLISH